MFGIEKLGNEELTGLIAACQSELENRKQRCIQEIRQQIIDLAGSVGMSPLDLLSAGKARHAKAKLAPKYRNPENPEQTWAGRGKRPGWVNEQLEQGKDLEEVRIAA